MLIQFRFKNHKCFYDEAVLDLTATSEKRHDDCLIKKNGYKILPFVSIHGANAAGKSSVIDAFFAMTYLVIKSFDLDNNKPFRVMPFIFNENYINEDSEFEIFLNIDDKEYRYGFIANQNSIVEEWLTEKPFKATTTAKEKILYNRKGNKLLSDSSFELAKDYEQFIDNKTLLLSILGRKQIGIAGKIYGWFLNSSYVEETFYMPPYILKMLEENNILKETVMDFMKEVDPCLVDLLISKDVNMNNELEYKIMLEHYDTTNKGIKYQMSLTNESLGTQKALRLLPLIFESLASGSVLFIDELDTQFHPLLYRKIVRMFADPNINNKNAQLIYTCHSTYLFNSKSMRRDQIYFVDKDKNGLSQLYSLSEYSKLRGDADYEKKYLAGEFGAIPFAED